MNVRTEFPLQSTSQFGLYLRSLRRLRGLTQGDLGERMGVTGARISEIERDPSAVGLTQVLRLLHVLGARIVLDVSDDSSKSETRISETRGEW
jgi:HTH-type transcriptional regulator / antitoxin HipB